MTDRTTIDGPCSEERRATPHCLMRGDRGMALVRSLLARTRLLRRVVRSLFKRTDVFVVHQQRSISSLLLKPTQALMLAGIRCAGAGGGGPGH